MKVKIAVATSPGAVSGSRARRKAPTRLQPPTSAASSISFGTFATKPPRIEMVRVADDHRNHRHARREKPERQPLEAAATAAITRGARSLAAQRGSESWASPRPHHRYVLP